MNTTRTKHVALIHVQDPDTGGIVPVEIRKLETGAMVGLDGSFLEQLEEGDIVFSPYSDNELLEIPDDEQG